MKLRLLRPADYASTYAAMQAFTAARVPDTPDELWLCEHPPVYTLGQAGQRAHLLSAGQIPVIQTDRGGQVTYHGPGQVVAYALVDLRRAGYYVKEYVFRLERAVINTLEHFGITGHRVAGAPGIYVRLDDPHGHAMLAQRPQKKVPGTAAAPPEFEMLGKIAALGVKVSRHCAYHGVALNVAVDLPAFARINPCGYAGLQTTDLSTIGASVSWEEAAQILSAQLMLTLAS